MLGEIVTRLEEYDPVLPLSHGLTDNQLEARLYPERQPVWLKRLSGFAAYPPELKHKAMTTLLPRLEYPQQTPETAYGYTQYSMSYRELSKKLKCSFGGTTVPGVNANTSVISHAQIFHASLRVSIDIDI